MSRHRLFYSENADTLSYQHFKQQQWWYSSRCKLFVWDLYVCCNWLPLWTAVYRLQFCLSRKWLNVSLNGVNSGYQQNNIMRILYKLLVFLLTSHGLINFISYLKLLYSNFMLCLCCSKKITIYMSAMSWNQKVKRQDSDAGHECSWYVDKKSGQLS